MEFEAVARAVAGLPYMTPAQGRVVYDHVRSSRPEAVLEIGTAHGVSTAYIAAALAANGAGNVTTVDHVSAAWDPPPERVLAEAALADWAEVVRVEHSSYAWWLRDLIEQRSDPAGNCAPLYDFAYLDGGHSWVLDGFTALLVEKLLRPGGWLLMDDLGWTFAENPGHEEREPGFALSEGERAAAQLRDVFTLLIAQHPSFTELRIEDDQWGWARKAPGEPRRLELRTSQSPAALAASWLRHAMRRRSIRKALRRPAS